MLKLLAADVPVRQAWENNPSTFVAGSPCSFLVLTEESGKGFSNVSVAKNKTLIFCSMTSDYKSFQCPGRDSNPHDIAITGF